MAPRARLLITALAAVVLLLPAPIAAQATDSTLLPAKYDVRADIDYGGGTITVRSTATVTNNTAKPLGELVFNLPTLRTGNAVLGAVSAGHQPAAVESFDQSIVVGLPESLAPGASRAITINYAASFASDAGDKDWLFAKLNGTLTAYRWIPWLSSATPFDRPNFGSPFSTGVSSYVKVRLTSEQRLIYGTSGRLVSASTDGLTRTFVAYNVRDFNFAADPNYRPLVGWSGGKRILVLTKSLSASRLLDWAGRSLEFYSDKVGPYAYPQLVVAEIGGGSGMESPAMVWLPNTTKSSNLPYLVAHEVAHQWFYAMIGSDQARDPFADEGPADFLARKMTGAFRGSKCSSHALDGTIWDYGSACYFEIVYVQGGNYLNAFRTRHGTDAFWAGLRSYYDQYLFKVGGTQQLWDALDAAAGYSGGHADRFPRYFSGGGLENP